MKTTKASNITLNMPRTIEFGAGKIETLISHLDGKKRIFLLVDPPIKNTISPIISNFKNQNQDITFEISTDVIPEPPITALNSLIDKVHQFNPDCVVGVGGGSAMDLAKLVANLFSKKQNINDVIGMNLLNAREILLIAVSTTSGTGSEVTPIAVLTDEENKLKKGVVSQYLIPDVAIVDPALTLTVPPAVTAATGMDALTHSLEAFTNRFNDKIINNFALEGIALIANNLETAYLDGDNLEAREALALGSLYGGLCLGPVNTALVHAMAYPLGGEFKISHGVSNSLLLPYVMEFNLSECVTSYAIVAKYLNLEGRNDSELADNLIKHIKEISRKCRIPQTLKEIDIPNSSIESMSEATLKVTRLLNNNPKIPSKSDLINIYTNAYKGNSL